MSRQRSRGLLRWIVAPTLVSGILSIAGIFMSWIAPSAATAGLAAAERAICQDGNVAYTDQKIRTKECLRRTLAKIEHDLAKRGVHSPEFDALKSMTEGE